MVGFSLAAYKAWSRVWLIPEAYPIVGAVGVGIAAGAYFSYHKLFRDVSVVLNKDLRSHGLEDQVNNRPRDIGHTTELHRAAPTWSARVFQKESNPIQRYNTPAFLAREKQMIAEAQQQFVHH